MTTFSFKAYRSLIILLGIIIALGPLSIDLYLPAFPQLARSFDVPVSFIELSLTSYFIGLSLGQLLYGPFSDRYGRKPLLLIGLFIYILTSIGCAYAPNVQVFIGLRFFQALGGCAGMVISRAIVRDLFDHRQSAKVFSALVLVMGLAPILAPMIGGYLSVWAGWQSLFWFLAIISMVPVTALYWLPETHGPHPEMKWKEVFSSYLVLFKERDFIQNAVAGGFAQAGMFAYITASPFVIMEFFEVLPQNYGWFFGANAVGLIFVSQLNSRFVDRYDPEKLLFVGLIFVNFFALMLFLSSIFGGGLPFVAICLFGYLSSMGIVFPNSTAGALANQAPRAGAASALLGSLQFVLATLASSAVSVFHAHNAFPMAIVMLSCALLAMAVFYFLKSRPLMT